MKGKQGEGTGMMVFAFGEARICGASGHSLAISSCHNQLTVCIDSRLCVDVVGGNISCSSERWDLASGDWNRQL